MQIRSFFQSLIHPPKMPRRIQNPVLRTLLSVCGWGILLFLPVYCLLMTEYIHYADKARFAMVDGSRIFSQIAYDCITDKDFLEAVKAEFRAAVAHAN